MRMSFFWYDASSPVERCAHRRAGLAPVAVREGAGCGTDLESEEDDVGVAPEAYARGSLLDCLERILDLHGVRAHVSAESVNERESECAGRVIWRAVGGGEDAHLVEAALGAEGRVVVVVRVAVHRAGRWQELYEARGGALDPRFRRGTRPRRRRTLALSSKGAGALQSSVSMYWTILHPLPDRTWPVARGLVLAAPPLSRSPRNSAARETCTRVPAKAHPDPVAALPARPGTIRAS